MNLESPFGNPDQRPRSYSSKTLWTRRSELMRTRTAPAYGLSYWDRKSLSFRLCVCVCVRVLAGVLGLPLREFWTTIISLSIMSPGQGPARPPPPCPPPPHLYSPWFLAEPPGASLSLLIRPFWSEHSSHLSASSATLCDLFIFFLFLALRSFDTFSSPPPAVMRWRDREGTGFIVKSRSYRTIQPRNRIKALTLDPRYLRHQLNEWRLKGEKEFPLSLWPRFLSVVLLSLPLQFFIFNLYFRCNRGDRCHRLCPPWSTRQSNHPNTNLFFLSIRRSSSCNLCGFIIILIYFCIIFTPGLPLGQKLANTGFCLP